MSSDRLQVHRLTEEWGSEIGIDPMTLARSLFGAAFAGEFEELPAAKRLTVWDDKRLVHVPILVNGGKGRYSAVAVDLAIRTGAAWIDKEAVRRFAATEGREFPLPRSWTNDDPQTTEVPAQKKTNKIDAVALALQALYPKGREHFSRQTMANSASEAVGETVSIKTLERAMNIVWPRKSAKSRHQ